MMILVLFRPEPSGGIGPAPGRSLERQLCGASPHAHIFHAETETKLNGF